MFLHQIIDRCLHDPDQYVDPEVPCEELTDRLESLYLGLAFCFCVDNVIMDSKACFKAAYKRHMFFSVSWPAVAHIVTAVLQSYNVPNCKECGIHSPIRQCLCLDRIIVLWRIICL